MSEPDTPLLAEASIIELLDELSRRVGFAVLVAERSFSKEFPERADIGLWLSGYGAASDSARQSKVKSAYWLLGFGSVALQRTCELEGMKREPPREE